MADDFPYCIVPGKLKSFFSKIQEIGMPESGVTQKWLASIGFASSNDRSMVRVLKTIEFIDNENKPTSTWSQFRSKAQAPSVLANAIKVGYSGLYKVYPDAHQRPDQELKDFFAQHSSSGRRTVALMVSAFKNLVDIASFDSCISPDNRDLVNQPEPVGITQPEVKYLQTQTPKMNSLGMAININIQLTLPETTDETVYDKLFASLKKHFSVE